MWEGACMINERERKKEIAKRGACLGLVSLSVYINWTQLPEWWLLNDFNLLHDCMSIQWGSCQCNFLWCTNPGRISFLNGFKSDWMIVHIPIQNGIFQRLVLYKTIENSNIKINRKILLFSGKILIFVRTRYRKVEGENKKCFSLTIYCVISTSFTWKY